MASTRSAVFKISDLDQAIKLCVSALGGNHTNDGNWSLIKAFKGDTTKTTGSVEKRSLKF